MRLFLLRLVLCLFAATAVQAQDGARTAWLDVSLSGGHVRSTAQSGGVTGAAGGGLSLAATLRATPHLGATLYLGYARLGIDQPDVVDAWGWAHWERYYRTFTQNLAQDPSYRFTLTPVQPVALYRVGALPAVALAKGRLTAQFAAGPTVTYYRRELYLDEQWEKTYPDLAYTYTYAFRNYAPDKRGYAWGVDARVQGAWRLSPVFRLHGAAQYGRFLNPGALPFDDVLSVELGLTAIR